MTNATSSKMSVEDMIGHYQRSIERSQHDPKRILHCIGKLQRMDVTVQHLQTTGIGRTVNSLRKDDGEVGAAAKALISKWKEMVANDGSDGSEEEKPEEYEHEDEDDDDDDEDADQMQIDTVSSDEKKSYKHHEHTSKSSTNNSNHHHNHHNHHQHQHHHREQHPLQEHRSPGKLQSSNNHSHQRKYSSDDTQEHPTHSTHSKHKHKSHSHDDGSSKSRKREREIEQDSNSSEYDRHKSSSKHSKEDRHHRSRHETQHNGDVDNDKKHRSKDHDKPSNHHKSQPTNNEKTHSSSKHKRSRESDHTSSSPKKQKCDSISSTAKSDEKKASKSKFKAVDDGIEIDHSMGTSFADALGMLAPMPSHSSKASASSSQSTSASAAPASSSKSSSKSSTVNATSSSSSSSHSKHKVKDKLKASTSSSTLAPPSLLLKKPKLPPLEDLVKDLPPPAECIIPNDYKPSPINPMVMDCLFKGQKSQPMLSETDSLCASTTSKNQRTKVYSGVKSGALLTVLSLHELCIRFLQKNIDALEYTGGVPFEILKPVLERATPEQLNLFEHYNPYLMDDSDCLWQQHCQRRFKAYKRQEMETWREMYYRCMNEQENRLSKLTRNIKESQSVALPVRQTKLAYVDSMVKPPRNVIKKQNQFGTHSKLIATPAARTEALSGVAANMTKVGDIRLRTAANIRDTAQAQPNGIIKPKKAPLMAKTLQLMKGRFKR